MINFVISCAVAFPRRRREKKVPVAPLFFVIFELFEEMLFLDMTVEGGAVCEFQHGHIKAVEVVEVALVPDVHAFCLYVVFLLLTVEHIQCHIAEPAAFLCV